jgi:hypothetical protein
MYFFESQNQPLRQLVAGPLMALIAFGAFAQQKDPEKNPDQVGGYIAVYCGSPCGESTGGSGGTGGAGGGSPGLPGGVTKPEMQTTPNEIAAIIPVDNCLVGSYKAKSTDDWAARADAATSVGKAAALALGLAVRRTPFTMVIRFTDGGTESYIYTPGTTAPAEPLPGTLVLGDGVSKCGA